MVKGGDTGTDEAVLSSRVEGLVKLGLEKYGEGDLVGALSEWEHALALKPGDGHASKYVQYVRDNFDLLEEQFQEARAVAAAAAAEGVPFVDEFTMGGVSALDDDEDAYEAFELGGNSEQQLTNWVEEASVDEGWVLGDFAPAEPLPPMPGQADPGMGLIAEGMAAVAGGEVGDGAAELARDASLRESFGIEDGIDMRAETAKPEADEADFGELNDMFDEPGPAAEAPAAAPSRELELDDDLEETVPGGEEPPPLPERPSLSDEVMAAIELGDEMSRDNAPVEPPPGTGVPADFDLSEVGRLDDGMRDDRIVEPDSVKEVRVTFHEVGTSEKTMPARPSYSDLQLPAELELGASGALAGTDPEDALEETVERDSMKGQWPAMLGGLDDDEEDEETRERSSIAGGLEIDSSTDRPPTVDPALQTHGVIVDEAMRDAPGDLDATREVPAIPEEGTDRPVEPDAMHMEAVAAQIDRDVDAGIPADEPPDGRTRRRVGALIERAEREFAAGHFPIAVAALDLALDEKPESAIAQKIVHRHRDLLLRIYESYIGDDTATPLVALPAHEIALQALDSRAAFLLSRIDGMLTFEEILDVAGMSRLEAYRHLCRLLLRGILEVR
jgi:hypothetical protein